MLSLIFHLHFIIFLNAPLLEGKGIVELPEYYLNMEELIVYRRPNQTKLLYSDTVFCLTLSALFKHRHDLLCAQWLGYRESPYIIVYGLTLPHIEGLPL